MRLHVITSTVLLLAAAAATAGPLPLKTNVYTAPNLPKELSGKAVFKMNGSAPHERNDSRRIEARSDETTYTVRCKFDIDPEIWRASQFLAYNESTSTEIYYEEGEDGLEFSLPAGNYDFMGIFNHLHDNGLWVEDDYKAFVVLENITIGGDTEISFDPESAVNRISFMPVMPDGTDIKLPVYTVDDDWNYTLVKDGDAIGLGFFQDIAYKGIPQFENLWMVSPIYTENSPTGPYDPFSKGVTYINDVSDNYMISYVSYALLNEDNDSGTIIAIASQKGSKTTTLHNNPATYRDLAVDFTWTPLGKNSVELAQLASTDERQYNYWIDFRTAYSGELSWFGTMCADPLPNMFKMKASTDECSAGIVEVSVSPSTTEYWQENDGIYAASQGGIYLRPFDDDHSSIIYFPTGWLSNQKRIFPGNETYMVTPADNNEAMYATAPMALNYVRDNYDPDKDSYMPYLHNHLTGRLNENRISDLAVSDVKLYLNGEIVAEGDNGTNNWWYNSYSPDMAGEIRQTIIDTNFEAEGLTGGVECEVSFDLRKEDHFPPSMTMLQFRDSDGHVTSAFNEGSKGSLLMSAADINCIQGDFLNWGGRDNSLQTSAPTDIKAEIAPHGTNNFVTLDIEENSSLFYPGFGSFYSSTLDAAGSAEGWWDLRVTLTDASGNRQTQTIKLAFKIGQRSSIETVVSDDDITVGRDGNTLTAPGATSISITALDGRTVATSAGDSADISAIAPGVYIVSVSTHRSTRTVKLKL